MTVTSRLLVTCAVFLAFVGANPCRAVDDSEDVIKYRESVMKAAAGHMAASAAILRGKVSYADHLIHHADAIAASMAAVVAMFPEGSDFGDTRALMAVWDDREGFEAAADEAARAAAAFQEAVQGGDRRAMGRAFKGLSDGCKGCHKDYREEE